MVSNRAYSVSNLLEVLIHQRNLNAKTYFADRITRAGWIRPQERRINKLLWLVPIDGLVWLRELGNYVEIIRSRSLMGRASIDLLQVGSRLHPGSHTKLGSSWDLQSLNRADICCANNRTLIFSPYTAFHVIQKLAIAAILLSPGSTRHLSVLWWRKLDSFLIQRRNRVHSSV